MIVFVTTFNKTFAMCQKIIVNRNIEISTPKEFKDYFGAFPLLHSAYNHLFINNCLCQCDTERTLELLGIAYKSVKAEDAIYLGYGLDQITNFDFYYKPKTKSEMQGIKILGSFELQGIADFDHLPIKPLEWETFLELYGFENKQIGVKHNESENGCNSVLDISELTISVDRVALIDESHKENHDKDNNKKNEIVICQTNRKQDELETELQKFASWVLKNAFESGKDADGVAKFALEDGSFIDVGDLVETYLLGR